MQMAIPAGKRSVLVACYKPGRRNRPQISRGFGGTAPQDFPAALRSRPAIFLEPSIQAICRLNQPWGYSMKASIPALARAERFLEKSLKLEHGANVFPLFHVFFYYSFFLILAVPWLVQWLPLKIVLWILLVLLNYSLTIGIMHMHSHRPLFTSPRRNRVLELLLCFPSCVAFPVVKYSHAYIHHTFDNGPKDFTSTPVYGAGGEEVWRRTRYRRVVAAHCAERVFARDAKPCWRRMRAQYVRDSLITISLFGICFFLNP